MISSFINNNFLIKISHYENNLELESVKKLTEAKTYLFHQKRYHYESFLNNFTYMPAGLWKRVFMGLQKSGFRMELSGIQSFIDKITEDEFSSWLEIKSNINREKYKELHWWQFDGAISAIKYRFSRSEMDTGAGKTLLMWLITKFLLQQRLPTGNKVLIVVNRTSLVRQIATKDFPDFSADGYLRCDTVYGDGNEIDNSNVVVGTYQSLKDYPREYFAQFGAIFVDECHSAIAESIKTDIIGKLNPGVLRYIHGLSATMHEEDTIPGLTLEAYLGPIMMRVPLQLLQEAGAVTPVKISMMKLTYPKEITTDLWFDEDINHPSKKLPLERDWIHRQYARMYKIGQACINYPGNHVLMCESLSAVKRLQKYLTLHCPNHTVNIIYGDVKTEERERIQNLLEVSNDNITIATSDTMGTGISIKNIHAVHLCDGGKSFIKVRQQIGRGVRLHPSKKFLMIFDWWDDIKKDSEWPGSSQNKLYTHGLGRKTIYDSRDIPYIEYPLNMEKWSNETVKMKLKEVRNKQGIIE